MIGGIIGGAMFGAGAAGGAGALAQQAAEIQRLRDERLNEFQRQNMAYAEQLRREPGQAAQAEIDTEGARPAYDAGADSVRPKSPEEMSAVKSRAYGRQGLIAEAQREQELETQRKRDTEHTMVAREGMRSHELIAEASRASQELIAKLGRESAETIAALHGTVQVDKDGKIQWVGAGGKVIDTGLMAQKDLSPAAKQASEILRDQLKAIDKSEADTIGISPEQRETFRQQRLAVNAQLMHIFSGGNVAEAFAARSPYPEGTELKGKDGKLYVVRDGQPVLKDSLGELKTIPAPQRGLIDVPPGTPKGDTLKERKRRDIEARKGEEEAAAGEAEARRTRLRKPEYDDTAY